jgi:hypothetical protein
MEKGPNTIANHLISLDIQTDLESRELQIIHNL